MGESAEGGFTDSMEKIIPIDDKFTGSHDFFSEKDQVKAE